ncbi:TetR/AcrR family transcriptional regulator [Cumulibacter manganitolerans]|uniref:TetR/AcrR family transcriptional regulator n=1 Tax=Cumulibacter manganitolerans TaxID=1884992 RepID=UPI0012951BF4|nr:TetR/AcrR family transcriptional regulator [Cumulibacter manganitolerans]
MSRRAYDNSARQIAARATRARILAAAYELLVSTGYASLSIADLARAAQVSPQTIYNAIGGKAEVLKACYDVTLAGDDESVAMSDRPEFKAMFTSESAGDYLERYARWCRVIGQRVEPIIGAFIRPGSADSGVAAFLATIEGERRTGTTHAMTRLRDVHGLRPGLALSRAVDIAWTLNSPEVYDRLVNRCGWSAAAYERWLAGQLKAGLL